jgi:cell fate (sporulation/competence/biofilm development) regulator YlbF (YheA/YmcA/DUF963 family)
MTPIQSPSRAFLQRQQAYRSNSQKPSSVAEVRAQVREHRREADEELTRWFRQQNSLTSAMKTLSDIFFADMSPFTIVQQPVG